MRVEAEDPQQPREPRQVAVDDALEVRDPATPPVLDAPWLEQTYPDQDIDGRDDLPPLRINSTARTIFGCSGSSRYVPTVTSPELRPRRRCFAAVRATIVVEPLVTSSPLIFVEEPGSRRRRSISLPGAPRLVGNRHLQEAGFEEWPHDLAPELRPVAAAGRLH